MIRALFILLLAVPLLTGCSTFSHSKKGTEIKAQHSTAELYGALHSAEAKLGQTHKGGTIHVRFVPGTEMSNASGWLGKRTSADRGVALATYGGGAITIYTTNGKWRMQDAEHEMAHAVLDARGVPASEHHNTMKKAGFKW